MPTPAYIPQISALMRQGFNYDMAISEEVTHTNEMTRHPIEDPSRSFIYDHNREEPAEMNLKLIVSTDPLFAGSDVVTTGVERLTQFQDLILSLRAAQSVGITNFFNVYTGLRLYYNMGIQSLTFRREPESPNTLEVDMSLVEFRFARPPRSTEKAYLMDGNDGPRNVSNTEIIDPADRPIVEATRQRYNPRLVSMTDQQKAVVTAGLKRLSTQQQTALGLKTATGALSDDILSVMLIDDAPSQQYLIALASIDYDMLFQYNQLGDRWSFTVGLTGAGCPLSAGRFIEPGVDLYDTLVTDQMLVAIDRPGISQANVDWYSRLHVPLSDGLPSTMLVSGSVNAFNALFYPRTSLAC